MMITFEQACIIARDFFRESRGEGQIASALESKAAWVFYPGNDEVIEVGGAGVLIDKATGTTSDFILPSEEGFAFLDSSQPKEVPSCFKVPDNIAL